MSENRGRDEYFLEKIKSIVIEGVEIPRNVLLSETYQWNDNV